MILLDINEHFPVGYIVKPHGLKGEMVLEVEEGFEELLSESEYLLVEVEGGLVPFFVGGDGVRFRTSTSCSVILDDIDSADKVRPFCGSKIYLPGDADREQEISAELSELIGFIAFDTEKGRLGEVIRVDDFSGNVVLTVQYGVHEILIPLSEDLITNYDEVNKELHLDCPEGLVDLYLE